jgi:hypothetical protein
VETVEIRCPVGPRKLLSKLLVSGEQPEIVDGNLIEFSCEDCRRIHRKRGEFYAHVLHRYNLAGELVETKKI